MRVQLLALLLSVSSMSFAQEKKQAEILPAELQIKIAQQAAPEGFKEDAQVLGYNTDGELVELKAGSNGFICLAPDYRNPAHYAAYCYPESLEPLMARGRTLTAEGKAKQKDEIRAAEIEAGTLYMPKEPTILYGYYGTLENLDRTSGEMSDAKRRYVIYVSGAMSTDLGLSNKPNNLGMPWLMNEGTYKAHIMITPPHGH